ncbi:MAG: helix-turn-helix transcriptional regulator [Oscillospiraceae bacterium]|nr:helix-turn-helix transcriptional regulator [Oscillospiraceae bacterium]MBR0135044.1 helix-turn-helix transcriptional regulator [Clostridia bacterium]
MFAERVNQICALLAVKQAALSRMMGCDKSNVSRMLSGARVPKAGGVGARRLADGLYLCADERGKVAALCELIGCKKSASASEIKTQLAHWLYDGESAPTKPSTPQKEKTPYRAFGEKLGAAMELTELSNIRLGRLVNVDPSYISRFRNGLRSPKSNRETTDAICAVLTARARERNQTAQLAAMMNVAADALYDEEDAIARMRDWLFDADRADDSSVVERLLENIDAFAFEPKLPPLLFSSVLDETAQIDERETYFGAQGLRAAVLRFLGSAIRAQAKVLYLYSDQSTEWMADPAFRVKWAMLMMECVKQGIHITIIHNIDRDLDEMISAITNWLPLYMSGMIESYYCKKERNARFSNTLFLCPNVACIKASNVVGQEDRHGVYPYQTEAPLLEAAQFAYDGLLAASKQLVKIYENASNEILSQIGETGMTMLGMSLSLATMDEDTLVAVLTRSDLDQNAREAVLAAWQARGRLLAHNLETGFVHECIPIADDERLFDDRIPIDLPGVSLFYTPQEYASHIRSVLRLSEEHPNYRLCVLPDVPFENTQIVISEHAVAVKRIKPPQITFLISHPAMCEAFAAYSERIKSRYKQDKISLRQTLERYL